MESKDHTHGAREEFFAQISNLFKKWIRTESEPFAKKCEEKILSITYDSNVALQKRVEELEAALKITTDSCFDEDVKWKDLKIQLLANQQLLTKKS